MFQLIKNTSSLVYDIIGTVKPEQILLGKKMFRPFMKFQTAWMKHFYPNDNLSQHCPWFYLQKYMLPLINQHGSSYHNKGIQTLNLNSIEPPNFAEFQLTFESVANGFKIEPVTEEINPHDYFELISQRKFPCVKRIRPLREIFCANQPDFWHEAIGHIAPLCFPEIQEFYLEIAHHLLASKTQALFEKNLAVAWTLMEYGFIKEQGVDKFFGAALVGSHLAHMRYINGIINVEPANRSAIIDSGFYSEIKPIPKNDKNQLRFFCLSHLNTNGLF